MATKRKNTKPGVASKIKGKIGRRKQRKTEQSQNKNQDRPNKKPEKAKKELKEEQNSKPSATRAPRTSPNGRTRPKPGSGSKPKPQGGTRPRPGGGELGGTIIRDPDKGTFSLPGFPGSSVFKPFSRDLPGLENWIDPGEVFEPSGPKSSAFDSASQSFSKLRVSHPVLMFPIRLETRFISKNNKTNLKIRIFPDQILIDDHDPRLSPREWRIGKEYWKLDKSAGDNPDEKNSAWSWLCSQTGAERASWVARQCKLSQDKQEFREDNEQASAKSPLLPDRWFAVGYVGGSRVFEKVSKPIKADLAFSPDLSKASKSTTDLSIDPEVKWLFDFNLALANGMALNVPLRRTVTNGLDQLFVFGIKTEDPEDKSGEMTPASGSKYVNELLRSHLYSQGLGFVPQGTPTNNTEESTSGWSAFEPDLQGIWKREFGEPTKQSAAISIQQQHSSGALAPVALPENLQETDKNYKVLERALGLGANSVLRRLEYREGFEQKAMVSMNTLLWGVTWGEYLTSMWAHEDQPYLSSDTRGKVQSWFQENVKGGSAIPTIRVGQTPYGILPVQHTAQIKGKAGFESALLGILINILGYYYGVQGQLVQLTEVPSTNVTPGDNLIDLLSMQPNPVEFNARHLSFDEFWITLWHDLVKMAISDDSKSQLLQRLVDYDGDFVWLLFPGSTILDLENIGEQRMIYQSLRDMVQGKLDVLRGSQWFLSTDTEIRPRFDAHVEDVEGMLVQLDNMLELLDDHIARGDDLAYLNATKDQVDNVLQKDHTDPNMLFSRHSFDSHDWPVDRHVIIDLGVDTVYPDTYLGYLRSYAQSFINSTIDVGDSPYIEKDSPLLYQLIRTAIARVGTNNDRASLDITGIFEGVRGNSSDLVIARQLMDLKPEGLRSITANLSKLQSQPDDKSRIRENTGMASVLRGSSSTELKSLSARLDKLTRTNAIKSADTIRETKALSKKIKEIAKDDAQLQKMTKKAPLKGSSSQRINEITQAIDCLITTPWDQLETLMQQTLGLAGFRLDAWIASFNNARLKKLNKTGIQIGAFGWVEDLRPRTVEQGRAALSDGYIHTPSLNHAKTAAVLRAGWNAYGDGKATSALAVDLRSHRIRNAAWLFDAIRQGQDLGDALGYRFERWLHEEQLDYWIAPVREAILKRTKQKMDPRSPVVDGFELLNLWNEGAGKNQLNKLTKGFFSGTAPPVAEIVPGLSRLVGAVDAMADAAVADSVHALMQGNAMRAGSSLAAINRGEVPPPELQVANTTRKGATITHRILMITQSGKYDLAWYTDTENHPTSYRARIDPDMEALVCSTLGQPSNLVFDYGYANTNGDIVYENTISLGDIFNDDPQFLIGGQDLLTMLPDNNGDAGCALFYWLKHYLNQHIPNEVTGEVSPVLKGLADSDSLGNTAETILRLQHWRTVFHQSRSLAAMDFEFQQDDDSDLEPQVNVEQLESRAKSLRNQAISIIQKIESTLPSPTEEDPRPTGDIALNKLQGILLRLFPLNLNQAIPRPSEASIQHEENYQQLWSVLDTLKKRLRPIKDKEFDTSKTNSERLKDARKMIAAILGKTMTSSVCVRPSDIANISASFDVSDSRLDRGADEVYEWLEKMSYVRPRIREYCEAMMLDDLSGLDSTREFQIGQWPNIEKEKWAALNLPITSESGRMCMLASVDAISVLDDQAINKNGLAGIVIDEVVERIPANSEDTGVAMHFDAPNNEAPQTLLLAMTPAGKDWDVDLMIDTLRDTLRWARIRAIDGENIKLFDHHLPAVFASQYLASGNEPPEVES